MKNSSQELVFLKEFIKHPLQIAAICPSSPALIQEIINVAPLDRAKRVVEFGSGLGSVIHELKLKMPADTKFIAIEPNQVFGKVIESTEPNVDVLYDFAQNATQKILKNYGEIDLIIAGLPFANFPKVTTASILNAAHKMLRSGGELRLFFYFHSLFFLKIRYLLSEVQSNFRNFRIQIVWKNFPPMVVVKCNK